MRSVLKLLVCLALINKFCVAVVSAMPDCVCDNQNKTAGNLEHSVELLSASNEVLRARMELLNTRLEQQTDMLEALRHNFETNIKTDADDKASIFYPFNLDVRSSLKDEQPKNKSCFTPLPSNCAAATGVSRKSGVYTIKVDTVVTNPFLAACDEDMHGGGWTIIQRRMDGSVDFYRDWQDYKIGFGNLNGEFFIGLDRLHALTTAAPQELLIVMEDFEKARKFAKYAAFAVGDESESYAMKMLGAYSGDAGDSLRAHASQKFTTKDRDNDVDAGNCAVMYTGAWWYKACHACNLNGQYLKGTYAKELYAKGLTWDAFRGQNYALKFVQMMIRPKRL